MNIHRNTFALVILASVGVFQQSAAPMRNNNNNNQITPRNNDNAVTSLSNTLVTQAGNVFNNKVVQTLLNRADVFLHNHSDEIKDTIKSYLGDDEEAVDAIYDAVETIVNCNNTPVGRLNAIFYILSLGHGYQIMQASQIADIVTLIADVCGVKQSKLTQGLRKYITQNNDCSLGMFYLVAASLSKDFNYYISGMDEEKVDMFLSVCTNGMYLLTDETINFTKQLASSNNFERFLNANIDTIEDKILELS